MSPIIVEEEEEEEEEECFDLQRIKLSHVFYHMYESCLLSLL
jgi:hypothetical protein